MTPLDPGLVALAAYLGAVAGAFLLRERGRAHKARAREARFVQLEALRAATPRASLLEMTR